MGRLKEKEIKALTETITEVKDDIDCAFIVTNHSFSCVGNKEDVLVAIAAGLQKLLYDGDIEKKDIEWIFNSIEYDKKEMEKQLSSTRKELVKKFMEAVGLSADEVEEVLNEEK